MAALIGFKLMKALHEAGIIPAATRRVVIDIPLDDAVSIYVETLDSEPIQDQQILDMLKGANVVRMDQSDHRTPQCDHLVAGDNGFRNYCSHCMPAPTASSGNVASGNHFGATENAVLEG